MYVYILIYNYKVEFFYKDNKEKFIIGRFVWNKLLRPIRNKRYTGHFLTKIF